MGELIKAEPGDAIVSSATNRILLNVNGVLRLFKEGKEEHPFGIEEYIKQTGEFVEGKEYTPSNEFITLALISHGGNPEQKKLFINKKEASDLQFQGSIVPFTLIIPKGQSWELRGGSTPLKSVTYAFFPG